MAARAVYSAASCGGTIKLRIRVAPATETPKQHTTGMRNGSKAMQQYRCWQESDAWNKQAGARGIKSAPGM